VVTGIDASGKAVFVSDGEPERIGVKRVPPGAALIWGWDATPEVPTDGAKPAYRDYFPPLGGLRAIVIQILPDAVEIPPDLDNEFVGLWTGADWDPDEPGMHRTNTIDIGLVLDGRVVLELDDGAKTELATGDWYVQNGNRHAWHNPYDTPCEIAIFLLGAPGPPLGSSSASGLTCRGRGRS
jgi:hypothetical protein